MTPGFALDNSLNGHWANAILPCCSRKATPASEVLRSNFKHIRIGQFGITHTRAECVATLLHHIVVIVLERAQEEMIGTNAAAIVATVQHPQTIGHRAISRFIGYTMGTQRLPTVDDLPVSVIEAGSPLPTVAGTVNVGSQSLFERHGVVTVPALLRAKASFTGGLAGKFSVAVGAVATVWDILAGHRNLLRYGVIPRTVAPVAGIFCCPNYTMGTV